MGQSVPPKHPSQRRRRNAEAVGTTKLPQENDRRKAPALPGSSRMLAETRAWWKTAWESPMAAVWLEADIPALVRLARLVDLTARAFGTGEVSAAALAEMRQLEDRLGLSPMARRRLQWEIEQAGVADETPKRDELAARRERFARAVGE